jgi:hypothetical protein
MSKDVFLCHASADKDSLARPLYLALQHAGFSVWFDEAEIQWGDSLSARIQQGLADARFVLVLLTPNFVAPGGNWRDEELHTALADQITSGSTKVLSVVHGLTHEDLRNHLPFVAGRRYERHDGDQSLAGLVGRLYQRLVEQSQPLLLTRAEVDRSVGTVEERLAGAKTAVWISGIDNMFVARSLSAYVLRTLERGVEIRILSVDPESAAADMLPSIDPRFPSRDFFESEVRSVQTVLSMWRAQFSNFQFRYIPFLPAAGYFITDPGTATETVKVELYTAKPWKPLDTRPHLVIGSTMATWRRYFVEQFENYWQLSRNP